MTKTISWSFPTSPNALFFGFPKGCWTVQRLDASDMPTSLAGFEDPKDAVAYARTLDMPWWPLFLHHTPSAFVELLDVCARCGRPHKAGGAYCTSCQG